MKLVPVILALFLGLVRSDSDLLRIQNQNNPVFSSLDSSVSNSGSQYSGGGVKGQLSHSAGSGSSGGGAYSGEQQQRDLGSSSGRIVPAGYGTHSFGDGAKQLGSGSGAFSSSGAGASGASSFEFGGAAESTGGYPSVYPAASHSQGSSGGYPSPSNPTHPAPTGDQGQYGTHGPSQTYYYQHYPSGSESKGQGGWGAGGGEEGVLGGFGGGEGGLGGIGLAGLGGIGGLKGLAIIKAVAKGILAIKPFLVLGLLFLIAFPILLFFIPLPIITITGQGNMAPGVAPQGMGRAGQAVTSYLTSLSEKVLNSEECLERVLCKLPRAPDNYQKKIKSLWTQYGPTLVKNTRVTRGLNAYFDTSSTKNRNFKCSQRFTCSNKFL